ncbi:hypothetical protein PhCBS80983_g04766 [Powellomyces hirtus]|uniref:Dethiobiotin synthase n=1 Tax=Powellomyces hirtus TaxID=109895 RepID=A0A507DWI1_9FUNG|nr:hypothetical protein PhCBS80983_g04766 [Powellomyces hirtus]
MPSPVFRGPMTSLRAFLPTFQVFAANTGVGKTLLSAALCRAAVEIPLTPFERTWAPGNGKERTSDPQSLSNRKVYYLKPVQTGFPEDSDQRHVESFCPNVSAKTLFTYREPAGPHLCAISEDRHVSDTELLTAARTAIEDAWTDARDSMTPGIVFVETAGGVTSPVMSGTPQASAYRPLRCPAILVGDANLGGISTTLSAYESLVLRGYDIAAVLMFDNPKYRNHEALAQEIGRTIPFHLFTMPPIIPVPRSGQKELDMQQRLEDMTNMMVWYEGSNSKAEQAVVNLLDMHQRRIGRLEEMAKSGESKIWWPFTQHTMVKKTTVIDSAYQDSFTIYNPMTANDEPTDEAGTATTTYDGCASWWTQSLGHAYLPLALAAANAGSRYGHVIFPECIHEPALNLAEGLLKSVGEDWASRVFFTDNGSTGMEVALKAGLKVFEKSLIQSGRCATGGEREELGVVGIEGGYHGDTIGAMDAASPNMYNEEINWYKPRGLWFDPPTIVYKNGKYHIRLPPSLASLRCASEAYESLSQIFEEGRNDARQEAYTEYIGEQIAQYHRTGKMLGSLIIEPLLLGAGGMRFVDPLFQKVLIKTVRSLAVPLPVIYDEVFVGFHRLGLGIHSPGHQLLGMAPDIACYAKNMSGGLVPTSATVVSERVHKAFDGETKKDALLHGHSYTAAPIGCHIAAKTLQEYEHMVGNMVGESRGMSIGKHSLPGTTGAAIWNEELIEKLSHVPLIDGIVCLGSVLAIELSTTEKGYNSQTSLDAVTAMRAQGVFARPLGNVIYIMAPYISPKEGREGVRHVEQVLEQILCNGF